ncbi:hypothetical protein ACFYTS_27690 [Nocardia sp. NPDC004151]|uniref:hypothetical protein n=1 Tax=Nocardia sp. NPDC004151 TaxID=3364304 RepID=UPI003696E7DD
MPAESTTPPALDRAKARELSDRIQAIMEEAWPYLRGTGEYDDEPLNHPVMRALRAAAHGIHAAVAVPEPRTYG